MNLLKQA